MDEKTSAIPIINNRYQILNTIASGGMAVIYHAKDLILERPVALKVLRKDLSEDEKFRSMFQSEAKSSANLSHPNIVTTYDFGFKENRLFIVMELIAGNHLKDLIIKKKIITIDHGLNLIIQASKGLAYAHQKGIIHCDVKPQNMLVSNEGVLKITDFGISRVMESISRTEQQGEIWGSPYYISPEIATGTAPSPASDIYSLGVVFYEVITGQLPFHGDDAFTLLEKHQKCQPKPPQTLNSKISNQLNDIILKALQKSPGNRYKNGRSFYNALRNFKSNQAKELLSEVKTEFKDQKKKNIKKPAAVHDWTTIILGFAAIVAIGGLIPFWLFIYFSLNR